MSQERTYQILKILGENPYLTDSPCRSAFQIEQRLAELKKINSSTKGENSEALMNYVIGLIQGVERVEPYHQFIGDLDADSKCFFYDAEPIFLQIKTSSADAEKYKAKIARRLARGLKLRFAVACFEYQFDKTIADFVDQVNILEGRKLLRPITF